MKRNKIAVFSILLSTIILFAGCSTKASTANWKSFNNKYDVIVENFSTENNYIFTETVIEATDTETYKIDLSSENAYGNVIYQAIEADDSEFTNYGLLKEGNQYQIITYAVSNYLSKYKAEASQIAFTNMSDKEIEVPQNIYASLYNSVYDLEGYCKSLVNKKQKLITSCKNGINENDIVQKQNFEEYLFSYQNLLENMIDINRAYQDLHYNYLFQYDVENDIMPEGQTQRWVDSAILYCGAYYFIKDFKSSLSVQKDIIHGDGKDIDFINFLTILNVYNDKLIADDPTAVFNYKIAYSKLSAIISDYDNFVQASAKIKSYLQSKNLQKVDSTRDDYNEIKFEYEFTIIYNQNILNLQQMILSYIQ